MLILLISECVVEFGDISSSIANGDKVLKWLVLLHFSN